MPYLAVPNDGPGETVFHFPFPAATRLRRATLITAPFGRLMGNGWTTNENLGMGQFFLLNVLVVPFTRSMIGAVQRTDPRCENQPVSPEMPKRPTTKPNSETAGLSLPAPLARLGGDHQRSISQTHNQAVVLSQVLLQMRETSLT